MDNESLLHKARQAKAICVAKRRATAQFTLSWRSGGVEQVTGVDALVARLGIKSASLPVLLSRGGGASFCLTRASPLTGEPDILTVTKLAFDKPAAKRGRPRTRPYTEAEMAAAVQSGTQLAPPAKTVPKRTKLRTDESQ